MIIATSSRRRSGTFYLAFLVVMLFVLLVTVLINAFRPPYSPPPPADPSPDSAGNIIVAGEITPAAAQKIAKNPPPCGPLFGAGHNYISFTCGDITNPSPNGPWNKINGWKSQGGAVLQKYNRNFGDKNTSRLQGYRKIGGIPYGNFPDRSNGVFMLGGTWDVFFFSGGNDAQSSLTQTQNLWKYRCRIDRGNLPYDLGASIGASTLQGDTAQITVTFLNQVLSPLGSVTIGPVTVPALGGVPKLILQQAKGIVPVSTRFTLTQMFFTRKPGLPNNLYNDGAIDEPVLTMGP